jgi:hypothetical protein
VVLHVVLQLLLILLLLLLLLLRVMTGMPPAGWLLAFAGSTHTSQAAPAQ